MRKIISVALVCAILAIGGNVVSAQKRSRISMAKARSIAVKRAAGKVESAELERERGKLVYSFDIRTRRGTIKEVWVDAYTGKVLSVKTESKAEEKNEREKEKSRN